MAIRRILLTSLLVFVLLLAASYILFPFYWLIVNSLKSSGELFATPVHYWPRIPSFENYRLVFASGAFVRAILNSLIVAGGATVVALALGSLSAYALG